MNIGTRVVHITTGSIGTIVGYPTEFLDAVSIRWDHISDAWPAGYVVPVDSIVAL